MAQRSTLSPEVRKALKGYGKKLKQVRKAQFDLVEAGKYDPRLLRLSASEQISLIRKIRERKRERGLKDFFYFSKEIYGNSDMTTPHVELCEFVTAPGDSKLILLPRGSLKSSVVTQSYSLWRLCQDPNLRVLICSEEYSKAKDFLKAVKACIEQNETFRSLYGRLDAKKNRPSWTWTNNALSIATRTHMTKEPNLTCAGTDSTRVGYHFDLIIMDDVVSDKNIKTDAQLKKMIDFYRLMLSILDPGGELLIIGTRWHFADLYGYLMEQDREFRRRGMKPEFKKLIRRAISKRGALYWPERLTKEFLSKKRMIQGPYHYSCQYNNDPSGGEDAIFKKEWLRFSSGVPQVPMEASVVLDPALGKPGTQRRKSDFSAITVRLRAADGRRFVVRIMRGKWNPTRTLQRLVEARQWVIDTYGLEPRIGVETVAFQWVMAHNLKELQNAGKVPRFRIYELSRTTETTKHMQIEQLVPLFEQGLILLRGKSISHCSAGAKLLIREYLEFPYGKFDDILDSLAYHEEIDKVPRIEKAKREPDTLLQKVLKDAKRRGRAREGFRPVGSRVTRVRGRSWQNTTSLVG